MRHAANIFERERLGQVSRDGGLDLAFVFAHFRRDVRQSQALIDFALVLDQDRLTCIPVRGKSSILESALDRESWRRGAASRSAPKARRRNRPA
jgi:hypothetical protein